MPKKPKPQDLEIIAPLFDSALFEQKAPTPPPQAEAAKPDATTLMSDEEIAQLDRTQIMLDLLIELDSGKDLVAALMTLDDRLTLEQYRYLAGPIIVGKAGTWESDVDGFHWLHKAIAKDRLRIVFEEMKTGSSKKLASNSEIIAVMYAYTMVAPMQRDWADVYFYACNDCFTRHKFKDGFPFKHPDDESEGRYESYWHFAGMQAYPVIYDRIKYDYEHLARDIRERVVKAAQQRGVNFDFKKKYSPTKGKGFALDDTRSTQLASTQVQQSLQL